MMGLRASALAVLLVASAAVGAAPPDVPADPVSVPPGKPFVVLIKAKDGKPFTAAPGFAPDDGLWFPGERSDDGSQSFLFHPYREGRFAVVLWTEGDKRNQYSTYHLTAGKAAPAPPPDPAPDPKPKPDPLPPAPEGFRVIFIYESSDPLTPAMQQVMFGERVNLYLESKAKGWRRFDKDVDVKNEKDQEIKALYLAARPKVTAVPCLVVAVGGKAEIIPFPGSEDEALKVLKKYGGE